MKFEVIWLRRALDELADLWSSARDRGSITIAAQQMDRRLEVDPLSVGESRSGSLRILMERPLAIHYKVSSTHQTVFVLKVWRTRPETAGDD